MSTRTRRSFIGLVIAAYVAAVLACTMPGQVSTTEGKPTVNIVAPAAGAQVAPGETVTVQVLAVDAQGPDQAKRGVTRVELWADNALAGTQTLPQPAPTYQGALTWVATSPGVHVLQAHAYNVAGAASDPAVVSVLVTGPVESPTTAVQPPATAEPLPTSAQPPATTVPPSATVVPPTLPPTSQPPATPKPTDTPPAPVPTGKIAFPVLSADRVHYDAWIVNSDGSNPRRIVARMRQPCLRPDGTMLAVNGEAQYQDHIIIMNADGSNQRPASQHVEDSHPSWSPDGNRLVYDTTAAPGGGWQICIVDNLAARAWHAIPGPAAKGLHGRYPTWMPDGRIIFNSADYWATDTQGGLYVIGDGGGTPTRVTSSKEDTAPAVAVHGGSTVAFMSIRQGSDYEIYTASVAGGLDANLKQLTDNGVQDGLPTWSPDGKFIAFVSDGGGNWGLWVMKADGSGRRKLLDLPGALGGDWAGERVSWSP